MNDSIKEDLTFVKNELESLSIKVDLILDMLNNFTIMLTESDDEDLDSIYTSEDSWIADKNEEWNSYQNEDDDDDDDDY